MSLTFKSMRQISSIRNKQWMHGVDWSLEEWMTALVGEVGEAANIIKKLNRYRNNLTGNKIGENTAEELQAKLADELGDIQLYLDLLAEKAGVDLEEATRRVFNRKSEELGFEGRL